MLGLGMLSMLARESRGDAIGEKGESSVSDDCAIIADCACDEEEAAAAEVLLLLSVLLGAVTARVGVCATSCVALGGPTLLAAASPMSAVVPPSPAAPSPSSISRTNKRKSGATQSPHNLNPQAPWPPPHCRHAMRLWPRRCRAPATSSPLPPPTLSSTCAWTLVRNPPLPATDTSLTCCTRSHPTPPRPIPPSCPSSPEKRQLHGTALLTLRAAESGVGEVHLDVYELDVGVATLLPGGTALATRTEPYSPYGQRLVVALPEPSKAAAEYKIAIRYTVGETPALCWLAREQTAGKAKPYLYTQGQACLNRGFFPTQDTPCIKAPFSATVRVPAGFTVAMSGLPDNTAAATAAAASAPGEAVFAFVQPMPIPAYLIAMAVGDLESRSIGPRSKVWAEPCVIESAVAEFSGVTEEYLQAGERLYGPYEWKTYDLLIMPPSFPYGGMENPNLTFVTPTLIAGDRSLTDTVMHEVGKGVVTRRPQSFTRAALTVISLRPGRLRTRGSAIW